MLILALPLEENYKYKFLQNQVTKCWPRSEHLSVLFLP